MADDKTADHKIQNEVSSTTAVTNTIKGSIAGILISNGDVTNGKGAKIIGGKSGIEVQGGGTKLKITNDGGDITGGKNGIKVNEGRGAVTIENTGGNITGSDYGIKVEGSGGGVTVNNTGTIEGTNADGIRLEGTGSTVNNKAGGTIKGGIVGISVVETATITNADSATIQGTKTGIRYEQYNTFTNDGTVEGTEEGGIAFGKGGELINNETGEVTGNTYAVYTGTYDEDPAKQTDKLIVTNYGTLSATGSNGIGVVIGNIESEITNKSRGKINGNKYGVLVLENGKLTNEKDATIIGGTAGVRFEKKAEFSNSGKIGVIDEKTNVASGIDGVVFATGAKSFTNESTGSVVGSENGVKSIGDATVTNKGTITGQTESGIHIEGAGTVKNLGGASEIKGGKYGVRVVAGDDGSGGTLNLKNEGTINGGTTGVEASRIEKLENSGNIRGGTTGIQAGSGKIENSGYISGGTKGIEAATGTGVLEVINSGTIASDIGNAIQATHDGSAIITNSGFILGDRGIDIKNGTVTNEAAGTVQGETYGVVTTNGTITNDGTISGGTAGVALSGGTLTNNNMISGGTDGVDVTGTGKVDNYGTIGEIVKDGVTQTASTGMEIDGADATVTNKGWVTEEGEVKGGTIKGTTYGVHLINNSTFTNESGATVSGGVNGIEVEYGNVKNYGEIKGGTGSAIHVASGGHGELINYAGGKVTGGTSGSAVQVDKDAFAYIENQEKGEIKGETAIDFKDGGSGVIENRGTIEGTGTEGTGIHLGKVTDENGDLYLTATIRNRVTGTISGGKDGMLIDGLGVIFNYGEMKGGTGSAFHVASGGHGELVNYAGGKVTGGTSGSAVQVDKDAYAYIENQEKGEIEGETAIDIKDGGSGDVVNVGTIEGTGTEGTGIHVGKTTDANGNLVLSATVRNGNTGTISGSKDGMLIDGLGVIYNYGEMKGGTGSAFHVASGGHGELVNYAGGKLMGGTSGAAVQVDKDAYAYVENQEKGEIKGETAIDIKDGGSGDVVNVGTIEGTGTEGTGIHVGKVTDADGELVLSATVRNGTTGTISGSKDGMLIDGWGVIYNYGEMKGGTGSAFHVASGGHGELVNYAGGKVTGGRPVQPSRWTRTGMPTF